MEAPRNVSRFGGSKLSTQYYNNHQSARRDSGYEDNMVGQILPISPNSGSDPCCWVRSTAR